MSVCLFLQLFKIFTSCPFNFKKLTIMKFIIYLIFVFLAACTVVEEKESSKEVQFQFIKVNVSKVKIYKFSEIYEHIRFIQLSTSDTHLVGEVIQIVKVQNKYFLRDNRAISIFDEEGKFLSQIRRGGKGPQEYASLRAFQIDTWKKVIEILDARSRKNISYDYQGKYIDEWKHGLVALSFTKQNKNDYVFYCGNSINYNLTKKLIFKSKYKKEVRAYLDIIPQQARYMHFMDINNFFELDNHSYFTACTNDTIYRVEDENLIPKYKIDFGVKYPPKDFLEKPFDNVLDFNTELRKKGYIFTFGPYLENKSFIYFGFVYDSDMNMAYHYYSKKSKQAKLSNQFIADLKLNNLKFEADDQHTPRGLSGNELIYVIEPAEFMEWIEQIKQQLSEKEWLDYLKQNPDIKKIIETVKAADNPILMLAKLKEF